MAVPSRIRTITSALATAALLSGAALAQTPAPAAPESDWTVAGNLGIYSQYVFRGVSQTNEKPALQGGFDLGHKSGFYAGTWLSNVSWLSDAVPGVSASLEWDMYGGYKGTFGGDFGYDVGLLYYYYPGSYPGDGYTKPDTLEAYVGLTWKFLSFKYSRVISDDTFGFADSDGSDYYDLTATYDIVPSLGGPFGKLTATGHVGHQNFRHFNDFNYTDWKIGLATEVAGVTLGTYYTDTDATDALYTNPFGKRIADSQWVVYVQKTF